MITSILGLFSSFRKYWVSLIIDDVYYNEKLYWKKHCKCNSSSFASGMQMFDYVTYIYDSCIRILKQDIFRILQSSHLSTLTLSPKTILNQFCYQFRLMCLENSIWIKSHPFRVLQKTALQNTSIVPLKQITYIIINPCYILRKLKFG